MFSLEQNKLNKPQKPLNKLAISLLPIRIRRFVSDATVHANSVWRLNLSQLIPSYGWLGLNKKTYYKGIVAKNVQ